jgi:hydrogenase maturation protease HycI
MTKLYNKRTDKEKRKLLRNNATSAEKLLWELIRSRQIEGRKFRRQFSVRGFVLDFYCPRLKLAIELDGDVHEGKDRKIYDKARQKLLECAGIRFLRFSNDDVFNRPDRVVDEITKAVKTSSLSLKEPPLILPLTKGEMSRATCPVRKSRDRRGEDLKRELQGFTSLAIIGVGSDIRGDDNVGLYIAEKLKRDLKDARCKVLLGGTTPENLSGTLKRMKPSHILLVDAASSGKKPGEISLIDPKDISGVTFSTHTFSLETLADYLKETIGAKTVILGIEPKTLKLDDKMSKEVLEAADRATALILSLLN